MSAALKQQTATLPARPQHATTTHAELARAEDERDYLARRVEELEADLAEAESILASALGRRRIQLDVIDFLSAANDKVSAAMDRVRASRDGWRLISVVFALGFVALGLGSC